VTVAGAGVCDAAATGSRTSAAPTNASSTSRLHLSLLRSPVVRAPALLVLPITPRSIRLSLAAAKLGR
jgi:hypothetical protein